MKHTAKTRILTALLAAIILLSPVLPAARDAAAAETAPLGYVVLSVEKFSLGLGYIVEPQLVPYYDGDRAGNVLSRTLGTGNFTDGSSGMGTIGTAGNSISYLNRIRDEETPVNPPQYILDRLGSLSKGRAYPEWLGQFDYASGSGWVYTANNVFPSVGLGSYSLTSNAVIRVQFSLYNGDGTGSSGTAVNRDSLARRLAQINGIANKAELLAENPAFKSAYDNANAVFTDLTSVQEDVDAALAALTDTMPESPDLTLTYNLSGGDGTALDGKTYKTGDPAVLLTDKGLRHPADLELANWNTRADGTGTAYIPGSTITFGTEDVVLFAVWARSYSVSYDAGLSSGGGTSVAPSDNAKYLPGRTVTLKAMSGNNLKPETGKVFREWNTEPDGTGDAYTSTGKMVMPGCDVTLYAIWGDGYRITYDGNGNTSGTKPSVSAYTLPGANIKLSSTGTIYRDTQRINGWNTEADGTGTLYAVGETLVMPETDLTLYASFADAYSVSYDLNGGTGSVSADTARYIPGKNFTLKSGNSLKKEGGFVFQEWNTEPDGTGDGYKSGSVTMGGGDMTFYAIYVQGYQLFYDANGGAGTVPVDTAYYAPGGSAYTKSPSPALTGSDGSVQLNWNSEPDGSGETYKLSSGPVVFGDADITVYAIYTQTYTITYDLNGGVSGLPNPTTGHKPGDYIYLRDANNSSIASVSAAHPVGATGMVFKGWSPDPDDPALAMEIIQSFPGGDMTLYAIWAPGLAVEYDLNGGAGTAPEDSALYNGNRKNYITAKSSAGITPPEGLTFVQWNTKPDGSGKGVNAGSGIYTTTFDETDATETKVTFYAIYKAQYVLKYDTNGGSAVADSAKTFSGNEVSVTNTVPTKSGVTFRRWNTEKDGSGIDYLAGEKLRIEDGDITLYARWSANNVYYDLNGGTGDVPVDGALYTPNDEITAAGIDGVTAPEGLTFAAWNTRADGSGIFAMPGETVRIAFGDMTLYAIWYDPAAVDYAEAVQNVLQYLYGANPNPVVDSEGGEWVVLALARGGYAFPADWARTYQNNLLAFVTENTDVSVDENNNVVLNANKYTDNSRVVLALTSLGLSAADWRGYSFTGALTNTEAVKSQGVNGSIFALIALNSHDYEGAEPREVYISDILGEQQSDGSWRLGADVPEYDLTAMAVQALAPYRDRAEVQTAVDDAIAWLSTHYSALISDSSESVSQLVVALTALGIDPVTDPRFNYAGKNPLDALLTYRVSEDGGFRHLSGQTDANGMATEQAAYAFVAYARFMSGAKTLYDMSEIAIVSKTALNALIVSVAAFAEGDYTADSWTAFSAALADAQIVAANDSVTQEQIDNAANALLSAANGLVPVITADKTALLATIGAAEALVEEDYTQESWSAFATVLADANVTANNPDATQQDIDNAEAALLGAINALERVAGDVNKTSLDALIAVAVALSGTEYTADSWAAFSAALVSAHVASGDLEATQDDVDSALGALQAAMDALERVSAPVNKTALLAAISYAENLVAADYTAQSWSVLTTALAAAKAVAEDEGAAQSAVNDAAASLNAAIGALETAPPVVEVNKTALLNLITHAEGLNPAQYTGASWGTMQIALASAKAVAADANATQTGVNNAAATLQNAIGNLVQTSGPQPQLITVSISVYGALKHSGAPKYIFKTDPNIFEKWMVNRVYEFDSERVTVYDVFVRAVAELGFDVKYTSGGNYVAGINGPGGWLSEFDNGAKSGWMYMVNGTHPGLGLSEMSVGDGAQIVWHYTDDYTREEGSEVWYPPTDEGTGGDTDTGGSGGDTDTGGSGAETTGTVIDAKPEVSGDKATSSVETSAVKGALDAAADSDTDGIHINAAPETKTGTVEVKLTAEAVSAVAEAGSALTIDTGAAQITLDADTLSKLAQGLGSADEIVIAAVSSSETDATYELTVTANGEQIRAFGGGAVTVAIAYTPEQGADLDLLTVYYISDDGTLTEMKDARYDPETGRVVFTTGHFSRFMVTEWINPFADADKNDWYYKAMRFAYGNGLMNGTTTETFGADTEVTRAMLVTMLYRLEGSPGAAAGAVFTDAPSGQWYSDAVAWAGANGIASGYGDGRFGVGDAITREQFAVMLYNYARRKSPGTGNNADLAAFADADSVSDWAADAVKWAYAEGLITGRTASTIEPGGTATRAEAAMILMRFIQTVVNA